MVEIFKTRANMKFVDSKWECRDEKGHLVCVGGPSIIYDNPSRDWYFIQYKKGLHRLDGPANSRGDWYIRGKCITYEIHQFAQENGIDLENLTDADKVMIALKFG